jgi:hypothetical protein
MSTKNEPRQSLRLKNTKSQSNEKKTTKSKIESLKDMPGHLRASSKKHAKQADQIEKTVKLAGKYMNQSND